MTKAKKATTVAGVPLGGHMAKTSPTPSLIGALTAGVGIPALTEGKTRSNVKGSVSGTGAKTAPNEPKLAANPDALLLSILRSSQQTNQVLTQLASTMQDQRSERASVAVYHGSSDGTHFDGDYAVTRSQNAATTMDSAALKRVRGEGSSGSTLNKTSGQRQSLNDVRNEVDIARAVYTVLREKLSDVLPNSFPLVSPRGAIACDADPDCKTDGALSPIELELMALRAHVRELHEDMAYVADHVRC